MKKLILIIVLAALILPPALYFGGEYFFNSYFENWGKRLVDLDAKGMLSDEYGAAWQDVLQGDRMTSRTSSMLGGGERAGAGTKVKVVGGPQQEDYPSLSIVRRLNEIRAYSNTIRIADRYDRDVAVISTDHTRARYSDFPKTLVTALVAAEDERFFSNRLGFEYNSFVRAVLDAARRSVQQLSISGPRGTSTITQQVAKLFVSRIDEEGRRQASRTMDRKIRELRISAALRKTFSAEDILEVYLNHCVASDHGLIGVKDISEGLFGRSMSELSDAQCLYIARMVKWGRNVPEKIRRQCRIDLPRMASALSWDAAKQAQVLAELDTLTFKRPRQIRTESGHLVDLANEFWLLHLSQNGGLDSAALRQMDLIDPSSLIRRKGNLTIRLTLDLPLQKELERLVKSRGYGPDTTIRTDARVGSESSLLRAGKKPADTLRRISVLRSPRTLTEAASGFPTKLLKGDTLISNIRYSPEGSGQFRRSCFYYARRPVKVDGQYFAYCILDAASGKLLAYYSRDKIGSRAAGLLRNRTPNGSSTAKPICNALNFDLGNFKPYQNWTDAAEVPEGPRWQRTVDRAAGEAVFAISGIPGKGYSMHNHGSIFEGCGYIFDHLASSNNILGVETVYRLDRAVYDFFGGVREEAFAVSQLIARLGIEDRMRNLFGDRVITGVRIYKELARIAGADADSVTAYGRRMGVSDSMYSIALGTLELSLYEQAHMFNSLYGNDLVENPRMHPSLVIEAIDLAGTHIDLSAVDTVKRVHPFADLQNLRPTWLGLHKRLVSNGADGLGAFDIDCPLSLPTEGDTIFSPDMLRLGGPAANYAKSGTTDDVLRPYDADVTSKRRTNYGLWNAVLRLDMNRLSGSGAPELRDVTVACIGECSVAHTGARDGKTLHKFLTQGLLQQAGVPVAAAGFFGQYERYIKAATPAAEKGCGEGDTAATVQVPEEQD